MKFRLTWLVVAAPVVFLALCGILALRRSIKARLATSRAVEEHELQIRLDATNRLLADIATESNRLAKIALAEARQKQQAEDDAKDKALAEERESKQRHEHLVRSLRNTNSFKVAGKISVAMIVEDSGHLVDEAFGTALSKAFPTEKVLVEQPFTEAFARDGGLRALMQADKFERESLPLADLCDYIFIARYNILRSTNTTRNPVVINGALKLECSVMRTDTVTVVESTSFNISGADLTNDRTEQGLKENSIKPFGEYPWKFLRK
jgi:hypothetical protein